ncbi:phage tail tape-measure protein [Methylobacterium sp. OAE515]|uniref:hypothetical protein n=1 Tax=Methylobacterium sp. OAE515 TaxID=2817895 RepID=UPI001789F554
MNELSAAEGEATERVASNMITSTVEGVAVGAIAGSFIPVIGTLAGGIVGGSIGWIAGLMRQTEAPAAAKSAAPKPEPQEAAPPEPIVIVSAEAPDVTEEPADASPVETAPRNDRYREAREIAKRMRLRPAASPTHH